MAVKFEKRDDGKREVLATNQDIRRHVVTEEGPDEGKSTVPDHRDGQVAGSAVREGDDSGPERKRFEVLADLQATDKRSMTRFKLRAGKIITDGDYDVESLLRQGAKLRELSPETAA